LKSTPQLQENTKTYTFEGEVSGYYNDPTPLNLRNDKFHKSKFTHNTTQYFFAETNPRLDRVLGSPNMRVSSKVFIDGDYRFPIEETSTPGYIEVRNITFNATNHTIQGGNTTNGTGASGGTGGNRRNVTLKSSPLKAKSTTTGLSQTKSSRFNSSTQATTPRKKPSQALNSITTNNLNDDTSNIDDVFAIAGPSTSSEFQPISESSTTLNSDDKVNMSFSLGTFDPDQETDTSIIDKSPAIDSASTDSSKNIHNKREADNSNIIPETSKRQRKPSAKAKERDNINI
jgi:hypothetical protein